MRFLIAGAGAVGSLLAAYLSHAGETVAVVARPAHAAAIRAGGLRVEERDGTSWTVTPAAHDSICAARPEPDDFVILTVKSYDTARAVDELAQCATSGVRAVACIQNGVANEATVAARLAPVYGVVARFSARLVAPGVVLAAGNRELEFGCYPAGLDGLILEVVRRVQAAGIAAIACPDIAAAKWSKLVMNCANAVYAICNVPVQAARTDPAVATMINLIWAEAATVLVCAGIDYPPLAPLDVPLPASAVPVPANVSHAAAYYGSTWDDLARRRGQTELPWLNGEIVRLAERQGMPAPINTCLLRIGSDMAERREPPGRYAPEQLLALLTGMK